MSDMFMGSPRCYTDIEAVQRALITEHAADAVYSEIMRNTESAKVKEVINEILKDEQNHQGRLQGLLIELRGGENSEYEKQFCSGLEQKEAI